MNRKVLATLLAALTVGAPAQMPPMGMKMPQAGPPQPGDAAMSCDQIGQEMAGLLKKAGVGQNREQNLRDACTLRGDRKVNPADGARAQAGVMANANTTMAAFSNPRVMRLGMLAQEKNCAASGPKPAKTAPKDPCDDIQLDTAPTPSQPSQAAPKTGDPFVDSGTIARPAAATKPRK
jgi:hypothetical protein